MKKLLTFFLSVILCISILPDQTIDGNYELDSLVVKYVTVARDIVQTGNDGNTYTTTYDDSAATYSIRVGWPDADTSLFDYSLPYWAIGDTIGVLEVPLGSAAALAAFGLGLNTDFSDGAYTINPGSVYPTTNTEDCVTSQVFLPIQDAGTWTDGGYDPLVTGTSIRYGWGIITSNVFATFNAPDFVNHVYGTDYGLMADGTPTAMPNWGYLQVNYTDDTFSTPGGLNIGWEAHDGPDANIGIVSAGDPYFVQAEADLGLLNNMVGRAGIPADSVTIPAMVNAAAAAGITIHLPTDNPPYMLGGPGAIDPTTGEGIIDPSTGDNVGAFTSEWGYIFDPTGDLLGGGDGVPFSGDEALQFTGYYATWNVLKTLFAVSEGAAAAVAGGAFANPLAPNIAMLADSLIDYTMYYWDVAEAVQTALNAGLDAAVQTQLTTWMSAGLGLPEIGQAFLAYVLGALTQYQAQLVDSNGAPITVNDSDHDLDIEDFDESSYYYYGEVFFPNGGRLYVQSYANCFPAIWSQYINSHWTYMGAIASVDEGIVAEKFELKGNYPNPFNPTTKIRFTNDRTSNVKVTVYSLKGEKVATILNKQINNGTYDVSWNGMNTSGKLVPSGMYLYDVESDGRRLQGKMLFLK
jgi:hypothetical protein